MENIIYQRIKKKINKKEELSYYLSASPKFKKGYFQLVNSFFDIQGVIHLSNLDLQSYQD